MIERVVGHPTLARIRPALQGSVAAVGGVVRDAARDAPPGPDLDLVVEGPAGELAARIGRLLGCRVTVHERFLTATVELGAGSHLDVVTARRERYPTPGGLPVVNSGTLADDLARRDFSVNAMAVRLPPAGQKTDLVDPHAGLDDLRAGILRALRAGSFVEDPSRVVRGARYAARLGFALDPRTEHEARRVAPGLDPSSARVASELGRLLADDAAASGCALLAAWGTPWLEAPDANDLDARFRAVGEALATAGAPAVPEWPLRLGMVASHEDLARMVFPGWVRGTAAEARDGVVVAAEIDRAERPSQIDALLRATPDAAAVLALAEGADPVAAWWRRGRDLTIDVSGADLVAAGVVPGPAIGRALAAVRAEVLDGGAEARADQLALALRVAGPQS